MWATVRTHRVIAAVTVLYVVALTSYGVLTDSPLAIPYLIQMIALSWVVVRLDARHAFSRTALAGLSLWGLLHMLGGIIAVGDATLYETWLFPVLRWDHVVHAIGFGFGGVATVEAFRPWMAEPVSPGAAAWVAFLGSASIGAINETVEFVASQLLSFANVGDEVNTGLDLIANAVGGGVAAMFVRRQVAREERADPPGTVTDS